MQLKDFGITACAEPSRPSSKPSIPKLVLSLALVPDRRWPRLLGCHEVGVTAGWVRPVSKTRLEQPPDRPVRPSDPPAAAPAGTAGSQDVVVRRRAADVDHVLATEVAARPPKRVRRDPPQRLAVRSRADRGICDLLDALGSKAFSLEGALTEASCV
jgi:hypothetical protein